MMVCDMTRLPFDSSIDDYRRQAGELFQAYRSGDSAAIRHMKLYHPRYRDPMITWLARDVPDSMVQNDGLNLDDAQLALARWYDFQTWPALEAFAQQVADGTSPVYQFEAAVEAVIEGEHAALTRMLEANPELLRARSTRITPFDPPVHRATLLHYIGANGVEHYRQKTPSNAVEIATTLLKSGAEVDATASLYGAECTTLYLLVSSCHPAQAGLQGALAEVLLNFGASIERVAKESALTTALVFGYLDTAEVLARRGARVDTLSKAAGLGRVEETRDLLRNADYKERHIALALAAQLGHIDVVRMLLDAGEDPNRYNPAGFHAHSTPLHQAIAAGREPIVRLLAERGARLDIEDTIYHGTALGWAEHLGKTEIASYLRERAK